MTNNFTSSADTCTPDWVSTRDNLIISSFVFSFLTFLVAGSIFYSQGGCVF